MGSSPWLPVPSQLPSRFPMCIRRSLQSPMFIKRFLLSPTMVENLQDMLDLPGLEAVQSLEIDWPAMQSPENGLANMFIVHVCTLLSSIAPLIKSIKFYCQSTETY